MIDLDRYTKEETKILGNKVLSDIKLLDRQLSEDKELFGFLLDNGLVSEECEEMIRELIIKHTAEFDL